jgi:hypothetical protein
MTAFMVLGIVDAIFGEGGCLEAGRVEDRCDVSAAARREADVEVCLIRRDTHIDQITDDVHYPG